MQIIAATKLYFFKIAIAIDQLGNTLLNGDPDETLSSRAYRAHHDNRILGKVFKPTIDAIFLVLFSDKDHCRQSYISEIQQKQFPKDFQKNFQRYLKQ